MKAVPLRRPVASMIRRMRDVAWHHALVGVVSFVIIATAEGGAPPAITTPTVDTQHIWLCGREHTNMARGYVRRGIVLDTEGNLWRYEFSGRGYDWRRDPWRPRDLSSMSDQELKHRYDGASQSAATVPVDEIAHHLPLIAKAAKKRPSKGISAGRDAGSTELYCLSYDAARRSYAEVLIDQKGDWERTNSSKAARTLQSWLDRRLGKIY